MNTSTGSILALLVCLASGCAVDGGDDDTFGEVGLGDNGDEGTPNVNDDGSEVVGGGGDDPGGSGGGDNSGCSEAAKQVYLVDSNYQFIKFEPETMTFTPLGALSCPSGLGATPNSMAVDRNGIAWVNYSDGQVYHVDVVTLACTASGYPAGQQGFTTFGMGFVSDSAGSTDETLYVTDTSAGGGGASRVATIDTDTLALTPIGNISVQPEFTGTGLGELWAFAPPGQGTSTGVVQQLDKSNASTLQNFPLSLPQPDPFALGTAWAFAAWGGFFYVFYQGPVATTDVYIFDPNSGTANKNRNLANLRIVGAGVSTCAPTEPPK
jgi:hypothetical protein